MADIFISYASEDRDRVEPLVDALQERGWDVWWDRELVAGPSFDRKIEEALEEARCVVAVWSSHSIDSRWVRAEANEGLERNILVPVLIDGVKPPLVFRSAQTAALTGWPDEQGEFEALIEGITALLGKRTALSEDKPDGKSVAVLPFVNMSNDPEQDFFGDGIAEEVINGLVNLGKFKVIARTSSFKFKGMNEDTREIGRLLNVTHLLEGSVRKAGNRLRVTAQLIDTADGTHRWSERFDRELIDVFALQDEITEAIVNALHGELVAQVAVPDKGTRVPEAYEAYLNGKYYMSQSATGVSHSHALDFLRRAVELDPDFSDAHGALAAAYLGLAFWSPPPRLELIDESLSRALHLNPHQPHALTVSAVMMVYRDHELVRGIRALEAIMEQRPNDVVAGHRLFLVKYGMGVFDIGLISHLIELDPMFQTWYRYRGLLHLMDSDFAAAQGDLERAIGLDANDPRGLQALATVARLNGDDALVEKSLDKLRGLAGERHPTYVIGAQDKALARVLLEEAEIRNPRYPMDFGRLAAYLGDLDLGVAWYDRAVEHGDFNAFVHAHDWMMGDIFPDEPQRAIEQYRDVLARPDYQETLRKIGMHDEVVKPLRQAMSGTHRLFIPDG